MNKRLLLFICLCAALASSYGQFNYKTIPSNLIRQDRNYGGYSTEIKAAKQKAYDLTNELPENYVKTGRVDYTKYIQKGLDQHKTVIMPDFPILVNENGLTLNSNSILLFNKNSQIVIAPNSEARYEILRLHGVTNVRIFDANIVGDRELHKSNKGEWGMGIAIRGSSNIKLYNPEVKNCWGDGIVIGVFEGIPSKNVEIINARLDFNRRNGIAIGSVDRIKIINPVISNTEGTLPMAGICIEPNNNNETCDNIVILNALTFNNANAGIQVGLSKLPGEIPKQVNIEVNKHVDYQSRIGFFMGGFKEDYRNGKPLVGKITISEPSWNNNRNSLKTGLHYENGPDILIDKMDITNIEPYQQGDNVRRRVNSKHKKIKIK